LRTRLVVLLQDLEFGGTQRYALYLLRGLDRTRFAPELWLLRGGVDLLPEAEAAGVEIVPLTTSARLSPWAMVRLFARLRRAPPDLLYTLTVVPNVWGRILGRLAGVPAIVSGYRSLRPRRHERWLSPLSRRILCNARAVERLLVERCGVPPQRIAVVPAAVDTERFAIDSAGDVPPPLVLSVGRLVREKNPLTLVEAFARVAERMPEARLELVGKGPLRSAVERRIRDEALESRVTLVGGATDVRPHLRRARVFALASTSDAAPNAVLEAMAMAVPVVATRVGGVPELVAHGETGLLVEPGDAPALAEALVALLTDPQRARAMGAAARERMTSAHSLTRMVTATERVLLAAVEGRDTVDP
jgi:glycosyltransferase involved in cell wall biosynthesis